MKASDAAIKRMLHILSRYDYDTKRIIKEYKNYGICYACGHLKIVPSPGMGAVYAATCEWCLEDGLYRFGFAINDHVEYFRDNLIKSGRKSVRDNRYRKIVSELKYYNADLRMQLDMREAIDDKIAQGFDVIGHDTRNIVKRGSIMLELVQLAHVVVKKYEE